MKITKRQLRRLIKEEKVKLLKEVEPGMAHSPENVIEDLKEAIVSIFIFNGEVQTNEIFEYMNAIRYDDPEIEKALQQLSDRYGSGQY